MGQDLRHTLFALRHRVRQGNLIETVYFSRNRGCWSIFQYHRSANSTVPTVFLALLRAISHRQNSEDILLRRILNLLILRQPWNLWKHLRIRLFYLVSIGDQVLVDQRTIVMIPHSQQFSMWWHQLELLQKSQLQNYLWCNCTQFTLNRSLQHLSHLCMLFWSKWWYRSEIMNQLSNLSKRKWRVSLSLDRMQFPVVL